MREREILDAKEMISGMNPDRVPGGQVEFDPVQYERGGGASDSAHGIMMLAFLFNLQPRTDLESKIIPDLHHGDPVRGKVRKFYSGYQLTERSRPHIWPSDKPPPSIIQQKMTARAQDHNVKVAIQIDVGDACSAERTPGG